MAKKVDYKRKLPYRRNLGLATTRWLNALFGRDLNHSVSATTRQKRDDGTANWLERRLGQVLNWFDEDHGRKQHKKESQSDKG